MISTTDISLNFGSRKLFDEVSVKFTPGNCYGVIGANGAGKSTLLKILSKEIEPSKGMVNYSEGATLSALKQDHFAFNEEETLKTVIMGNKRLFEVIVEKDALYQKSDFNEADGIRAAELEGEFAELNGWEAEAEAATLLSGLGLGDDKLQKKIKELSSGEKVKVLLAQALFGNPSILLLDEPTNHLDSKSIVWLENFLLDFDNTVIVVSHDRHFLNKVCTHMVDIDFGKARVYVGNYDFWLQASQLRQKLRSNERKKSEDKAKTLEAFIRRFSANASKSKQATSRRKQLDNLTLDDLPISSRKYPHIIFESEREAGDILLKVDNLNLEVAGKKYKDLTFEIVKKEKVIFVAENELVISALFESLLGKDNSTDEVFWGTTTSQAYLPKENKQYFSDSLNLIDWLREYSADKSEQFIRGYLGKMLFTDQESLKQTGVLSGGEKVRCMISKMMLQHANVLVLDGPTNHLDLESITAFNNALMRFDGTVLFSTHDQEFAHSVSNRVLEITPDGVLEHLGGYESFMNKLVAAE